MIEPMPRQQCAGQPYIPFGDVSELIAEATPHEDTERKAVYITLIQHDHSQLDDAGVINYNKITKEMQQEFGICQFESIQISIDRGIGEYRPKGGVRCN
jgi:hypothetical protein